ncbi:MAG: hypothetical protein QM664_07085 [Flavihumibacter sp.]
MALIRSRIHWLLVLVLISSALPGFAQDTLPANKPPVDSLTLIPPVAVDTTPLRIINLNPYITLHVDSSMLYNLDINRDSSKYFWYLRNAPVGLRIDKDDGVLSFKADKSYFLSGRLKYDQEYKVSLGVQNLANPADRVDTSFTLVFYNTEIVLSQVKPTVNNVVYIDEGDTLSFRVQCETGSFPIESINTIVNAPLRSYSTVTKCNDAFVWPIPFDFVKETDSAKVRTFSISFIGTDKFFNKDTAVVKVIVRDALNYPFRQAEYDKTVKEVNKYILTMKYTFRELDKKVKGTKNARSTFDIASGTSALTGTALATSTSEGSQKVGKVLPSVGVALVPVKEAASPVKTYDRIRPARSAAVSSGSIMYCLTMC